MFTFYQAAKVVFFGNRIRLKVVSGSLFFTGIRALKLPDWCYRIPITTTPVNFFVINRKKNKATKVETISIWENYFSCLLSQSAA